MSAAEGKAEAAQAMALLRKAVDMGYRDTSAFRTDSALDPLREREDFKKLLTELRAEIGRQAGEDAMIEATLLLEVLLVDPRAWLREAPAEGHATRAVPAKALYLPFGVLK